MPELQIASNFFFFFLLWERWLNGASRALETYYQIAFLGKVVVVVPWCQSLGGRCWGGGGALPLRQLRTLWSTEKGMQALFLFLDFLLIEKKK